MTTLNIHAQESKSRFSCLSASDPENIPDIRKEIKLQKSNKPWLPAPRAGRSYFAPYLGNPWTPLCKNHEK